jgi:glucose/arabinose dehydrogenase
VIRKPALAAAALVVALLCVGCSENEAASPESPLPTDLTDLLETPAADRELAEGVYALGWDGVAAPREVVAEPLPTGYELETLVEGLERPVGLALLPNGNVLVGESWAGRIRMIKDGKLRAVSFAVIDDVQQGDPELGLLGIAVDPAFGDNGFVYALYVESNEDGEPERSVLVRYKERLGVGIERTELAEFPTAATDSNNGGALEFGPDGKLYVTLGDTGRELEAADLSSAAGKVLRLNSDGTAPDDNPFSGVPDADPRVFAYGFRNMVGLAFHQTLPGRLIAPDNAAGEFDELNIVSPGANYGWPDATGFAEAEGAEAPVWAYLNAVAPAGMQAYSGDVLGEFNGDLFFCGFNEGGALHRVRFSPDFMAVASDSVIATGCSTGIALGPDGYLYFLEYDPDAPDDGKLHRIGLAGR